MFKELRFNVCPPRIVALKHRENRCAMLETLQHDPPSLSLPAYLPIFLSPCHVDCVRLNHLAASASPSRITLQYPEGLSMSR